MSQRHQMSKHETSQKRGLKDFLGANLRVEHAKMLIPDWLKNSFESTISK